MKTTRTLSFFLILIVSLLLTACHQDRKPNSPQPLTQQDINKLMGNLKTSMVTYLQSDGPPYTMDDINTCERILKQYLADMQVSTNKEEGMEIVMHTVLKLNSLNHQAQETLIETDAREQIAEIIILASSRKGYSAINEDVTEEWREW